MIIAVDGTSGSGKGTLAKNLAEKFDLAHLDTGLLYRAVAWNLLQANANLNDIEAVKNAADTLDISSLDNHELRDEKVAVAASKIATLPECRRSLINFQRQFAYHPPFSKTGAVLDGRDIGTIIIPDANFKLYLTAALKVRAQRRYKELQRLGIKRIFSSILQEMQERDQRDTNRIESPLKPASDAYVIDTSEMNREGVLDCCVYYIFNNRKIT